MRSIDGGKPLNNDAPLDGLRAALVGSSSIQTVEMTFEEALGELLRKDAVARTDNLDVSETAGEEGDCILDAILTTPPQTITDARVILDVLADPDNGIENGTGERDIAALRNIAALLSTIAKNAMGIPNGCWMEGDAK